jgi:hypothetical protein
MKAPIVIHWKGPYDLDELDKESHGSKGIYLFTGMAKFKQSEGIPYCGITEQDFYSYLKSHRKKTNITRKRKVWIGKIKHPANFSRKHLEHAEKLIIYYIQPDLNKQKKLNIPDPLMLISHWFKPNGSPRFNQLHPINNLPDIICWDGEHWRISNLRVMCEF